VDSVPDALLDAKLMKRRWRGLECRDERERMSSAEAKPEAGIVAETGLGFVLLTANQTEGYVLGAGKFVHLIGLNRSRLLVSTTLCEQKFRHCAMGCFRLVRP
jgi:hypothetical protein